MTNPNHTDCDRIRFWLGSQAGDGRRPALVGTHLAECPGCRQYGEQQAALWQLLGDVAPPAVVPSAGFTDRVIASLRTPRRGSASVVARSNWRIALMASAACLLVAAVVGVSMHRNPAPEVATENPAPENPAPVITHEPESQRDEAAPEIAQDAELPRDEATPEIAQDAELPRDEAAPEIARDAELPRDEAAPEIAQDAEPQRDEAPTPEPESLPAKLASATDAEEDLTQILDGLSADDRFLVQVMDLVERGELGLLAVDDLATLETAAQGPVVEATDDAETEDEDFALADPTGDDLAFTLARELDSDLGDF